jgi:hypothetical protein
MNRLPRIGILLLCVALAACASRRPIVKAPPPPPTPVEESRALVEAPPPADVPDTPLPVLKPGTELPESPALEAASPWGETASPEAPAMPQATGTSPAAPSTQSAAAPAAVATQGTAAPGTTPQDAAGGAAAQQGAAESDPGRFVGMSDADISRLLGPPVRKKDTPPSRVWTYGSTSCEFDLFLYPEVGGNRYRALTYKFRDQDLTDGDKRACIAGLLKVHAG